MTPIKHNDFFQKIGFFVKNHKILSTVVLTALWAIGFSLSGGSFVDLKNRTILWISQFIGMTEKTPEEKLKKLNDSLKSKIIFTKSYEPISNYDYLSLCEGGSFPKEYIDLQTHQHCIFEHIYLGNLRGYFSIDPNFVQKYGMCDELEKMLDLTTIAPSLQKMANYNFNHQFDLNGCSKLGIKYVLSVTQFKPSETVEPTDWSRFTPDLESLGVKRKVIPVDDDELVWDRIKPHLEDAFKFIDQARLEGKPCLIHCVNGASRSVTVLTAYLMNRCRVTKDKAFNFIKTQRTLAELKSSAELGLKAYEAELSIS